MSKRSREELERERELIAFSRRWFLAGTGAFAGSMLIGCGFDAGDGSDGPGGGKADDPAVTDKRIVGAAIHPGIGVARVGNSTAADGFFIGPEVVEPPLTEAGKSRDATGAIRRQAARFRVYGFNAAGQVVRELTADNADIQWTVQLANKKAAWYRFLVALDIPEATQISAPRRNADVKGADRRGLVIDPGPRSISGKQVSAAEHRFDGGKFQGTEVTLGELRTDGAGRLIVLGGLGRSDTPEGRAVFDPDNPDTFANADGWFDDISDGPVTASVEIDGTEIPVEPSWVIVAPPNYAPDIIGWRTLHDLLVDVYVDAGMLPRPKTTSFSRDILPMLQRLTNLQWVNKGFFDNFGHGMERNFEDPGLLGELSRKHTGPGTDPNAQLRQEIADSFRSSAPKDNDKRPWPWIYGDAFGSFEKSPRTNAAPSETRAAHLKRWASGDFTDDFDPDAEPPRSIDDVPLQQQPSMLDRAALHFCLGDAFHPGCEVTWPIRHATMYSAPFRIEHRVTASPEVEIGERLTAQNAFAVGGPLHAQGPGDLTRWMALPWQADTISCLSGYEPEFDPFIPTFWPARVPNHVLAEADYDIAIDPDQPRTQRVTAFRRRAFWTRRMTGKPAEQMLKMVDEFDEMGIVEARPGVDGDPDLPSIILVESLPRGAQPEPLILLGTGLESWQQMAELRRARLRGR